MAAVSHLRFYEEDPDLDHPSDDVAATTSLPRWVHRLDSFHISDLDLPLHTQIASEASDDCEFFVQSRVQDEPDFNSENQVNLVMDLFQHRAEESHAIIEEPSNDFDLQFLERDEEAEFNNFELDLGLGMGLGIGVEMPELEDGSFVTESCWNENDSFVQGRVSWSQSGGSSTVPGPQPFVTGVRITGFGSDSEEDCENENDVLEIEMNGEENEDFEADIAQGDETSVNLPWDSLRLEDHFNDEDFEWEEVDNRMDEREVLSVVVETGNRNSVGISPAITPGQQPIVERAGENGVANLEWQVLLTPDNLERILGLEPDAEYEMLFGQFAENGSASMGRPPASRDVIHNLASVIITEEQVRENNARCAVCKDDVNVGEEAKQLPCCHKYHEDCIVPWLKIRNTCPVCREELPTDDPNYERMRTQRAGNRS